MVWLNKRFNQSSLEPFVPSFFMLDHSMLCNVLVGDLKWVFVMLESSPTLILVPILFNKEKQKGNEQGLYQLKHWGA
jgi:hypothetical protein